MWPIRVRKEAMKKALARKPDDGAGMIGKG
jgi:hypothetical protein